MEARERRVREDNIAALATLEGAVENARMIRLEGAEYMCLNPHTILRTLAALEGREYKPTIKFAGWGEGRA